MCALCVGWAAPAQVPARGQAALTCLHVLIPRRVDEGAATADNQDERPERRAPRIVRLRHVGRHKLKWSISHRATESTNFGKASHDFTHIGLENGVRVVVVVPGAERAPRGRSECRARSTTCRDGRRSADACKTRHAARGGRRRLAAFVSGHRCSAVCGESAIVRRHGLPPPSMNRAGASHVSLAHAV